MRTCFYDPRRGRSASSLVVSINTMRIHTKSIYMKLGVNNRRAAVRRGQDLDLLSTGRGT